MAKGDRWSDDPNVEVRAMRNAETVLGVIREREFQAETTGELLEIERLTSSLEGGGRNRTQPVSRKGLRTPAQADTSPAAYPTPTDARNARHALYDPGWEQTGKRFQVDQADENSGRQTGQQRVPAPMGITLQEEGEERPFAL